jgi:hypothetical protein
MLQKKENAALTSGDALDADEQADISASMAYTSADSALGRLP